jgi:hypothetical protein
MSFRNYVIRPVEAAQRENAFSRGLPFSSEKLAKVINYLEKGQNVFISGRNNSGKTSFVDHMFFIGLFDNYFKKYLLNNIALNEYDPDVHFVYFSMRQNLKHKMLKWACLYMKLAYGLVIDIPTLTNKIGKNYELDEDTLAKLKASEGFFKALEEHSTFFEGSLRPSDIYNKVEKLMQPFGKISPEDPNKFLYKEEFKNKHFVVIIDNADYLNVEFDDTGVLKEENLDKRFLILLDRLKNTYKTTNIVIKPSKNLSTRTVKETEPSKKDLGLYYGFSDVSLILYNPFDEGNFNYNTYPVKDLIINNKNRFRTLTVSRNFIGNSNLSLGYFFLGECGYFAEAPPAFQIAEIERYIEELAKIK